MENVIISKSQAMKAVMEMVERFAPTPIPILLLGETGVGKNMVAWIVHELSGQKDGPFISEDVGVIPPNLIESALFGYEKGAFTGAITTHIGLIEQANGGTLFLDEIHNLSLELQAKYLKVVDSGIFRRTGGHQELRSRFRLIVATNENLEQLMHAGKFRKDFYYRVEQAAIEIPSLRERREDILLLAEHYVQTYSGELGKTVHLSEAAKDLLLAYPWPGNVRELMSAIHWAVIHCRSSELLPHDFQLKMRREAIVVDGKEKGLSLEEMERRYIAAVLEATNGNQTKASEILDVDRKTLLRKIQKYKL